MLDKLNLKDDEESTKFNIILINTSIANKNIREYFSLILKIF